MKRALIFWAIVVGLAVGAAFLASYVRISHERQCVTNMGHLYAAAISFCLEQQLRPDASVTMDDLATFVTPWTLACPSGHDKYSRFTVLEGPTCPNGHKFAPGEKRPLRTTASDRKLAALYLHHGFTNLVYDGSHQDR